MNLNRKNELSLEFRVQEGRIQQKKKRLPLESGAFFFFKSVRLVEAPWPFLRRRRSHDKRELRRFVLHGQGVSNRIFLFLRFRKRRSNVNHPEAENGIRMPLPCPPEN